MSNFGQSQKYRGVQRRSGENVFGVPKLNVIGAMSGNRGAAQDLEMSLCAAPLFALLCLCGRGERCVINGNADILIVVSEGLPEKSDTADMSGIAFHSEPETDVTAVVQMQGGGVHLGNLESIDECSMIIDHQKF